MNLDHVIIGTRGSKLALWQANDLKDKLTEIGLNPELKIIKTKGDKIQDLSFDKIEGKGFFTKEIEEELLQGTIDIAVHSLKDLPTTQPEGLVLAGLSERADCSDLLIIKKEAFDSSKNLKLKSEAVVGTSSIRRKTQLLNLSNDIVIKDLRGNVPTRINKLREGNYDAVVLASAGVNRLEIDLSEFETLRLNPVEFVPAPAQGVIAYQVRKDNLELRKKIHTIHHKSVSNSTNVERKVLKLMEGGCHIPLGVYCKVDKAGNYHTFAAYSTGIDSKMKRVHLSRSTSHNLAEDIVEQLKN